MRSVLYYFLQLSAFSLWLIFLIENVLITLLVLLCGRLYYKGPLAQSSHDWLICGVTNVLNTVVTFVGFELYKHDFIHISINISWRILTDFLLLFFAMDLVMFLFHFFIHKTFLYKAIHQLHHEAVDPTPIDLFVLHPVEALGFGCLWLLLLLCGTFNIYAIIIYLTVNVIFGLAGHLGVEPLPERFLQRPIIKYLGTSGFHHGHHQDIQYNFGFYTSIWDRLLGTYKRKVL